MGCNVMTVEFIGFVNGQIHSGVIPFKGSVIDLLHAEITVKNHEDYGHLDRHALGACCPFQPRRLDCRP